MHSVLTCLHTQTHTQKYILWTSASTETQFNSKTSTFSTILDVTRHLAWIPGYEWTISSHLRACLVRSQSFFIILLLSVTLRSYCYDADLQVISKSTEVIDHPLKIMRDSWLHHRVTQANRSYKFLNHSSKWALTDVSKVASWRTHRPAGVGNISRSEKLPMCSFWVYLLSIYLSKDDLVQSLIIHTCPLKMKVSTNSDSAFFPTPNTRHILWMSKAPYDAMIAYVSLHRCSRWESPCFKSSWIKQ